jgi:hypothetical protein
VVSARCVHERAGRNEISSSSFRTAVKNKN